MTRWHAIRRLSSYGATTALLAVVGLVSASVFVSSAGSYAWGVLASIQSAAALFGVVVGFGWSTTGAAEVARMPVTSRSQWFADSFTARLYLLVITYPLMVLTMGALNPSHLDLVLVGSLAYLLPNLGASWYYIGESSPSRLFLYDVLPQICGIVASIGVMVGTQSLVLAISAQLVFNLIAPLLGWKVLIAASSAKPDWSITRAFSRLQRQRDPVITAATSALYVSAPMLILNAVAPASLASYAMGDRLFRIALTVFSPILQFVQGWIPEGGPKNVKYRMRVTLQLTPFIGALGALCVWGFGPLAVALISRGAVSFEQSLSLPFAIVFLVVSASQVLGLACLIQLGRAKDLARSTVLGALAGVPMLIIGATLWGVVGAVWALVLSETIVLMYQAAATIRGMRRY
ncbi:lipopolysaccharide biosynthesis protein [Microbacterium laevaniformans]|nr:hypothetical protein [Microbacterium laevaniformans]